MKYLEQGKCEKCGELYCRPEGFAWRYLCPTCAPSLTPMQQQIHRTCRVPYEPVSVFNPNLSTVKFTWVHPTIIDDYEAGGVIGKITQEKKE